MRDLEEFKKAFEGKTSQNDDSNEGRLVNEKGKETPLRILEKIFPKWKLEVIKIIAKSELSRSKKGITSYRIAIELNKLGFRTRATSVYPFLETLIEAGISYRERGWKELGHKAVKVTSKGIKLVQVLETPLNSFSSNNR